MQIFLNCLPISFAAHLDTAENNRSGRRAWTTNSCWNIVNLCDKSDGMLFSQSVCCINFDHAVESSNLRLEYRFGRAT